jgi:hypothetical protein
MADGYPISSQKKPSGVRTGGGSPLHDKMKFKIMPEGKNEKGDTSLNKTMYKKGSESMSGKDSY